MPSDAVTGCSVATVAGSATGAGLATAVPWVPSALWRVARYAPPPAAARHPITSPPKTSLLISIS